MNISDNDRAYLLRMANAGVSKECLADMLETMLNCLNPANCSHCGKPLVWNETFGKMVCSDLIVDSEMAIGKSDL